MLSPEYALLGLLAQRAAHGYELHQRLREELGHVWHISLSQTYNILNRLESQGLTIGTVQEQSSLPARRRFRLTAAGRRRFEAWLNSPAGHSARAVRVEFITRLYFAHTQSPALARRVVEAQIAEIRAGLDRLTEMRAELSQDLLFNRLGLDLRIRQLDSILDWLAECRASLGLDA
jgi:DNA-binding PadR family transcriptional regulator